MNAGFHNKFLADLDFKPYCAHNRYMGRLKYILMSFLALVIFSSPALAQAATLSLNPSAGTFNRGCVLGVNIELDTQGGQTDGTDVILIFDPTKLSVKTSDITNGKIYQDYPGNSVDAQSGKLSISGISSVSEPFTGKGTFATVQFHVLENAPTGATLIRFDFDPNDKTKTTDTNVVERGTIADLLSSVTDGNYTVGTGSCVSQGQGAAGTTIGGQGQVGTVSATPLPTKVPLKELPQGGIFDNTIIIAAIGTVLTIIGIAGLAML
ncbi:MAG: hypothetical protein ACD_30C00112G0004 [uncultured bacterium]|uniref:Cohesin domain-containing protein n=4 Tax=Microgenomates group TaxID=1794810 RepID=A0A1F5K543_9BACT|nr:MAG: hypothetical protein ACD_30C00112G0004 [uncultured bacterium]KKQ14754.1 MAG: hypothetical protein US28_C0030G0007 [Candidatus Daviesbacteria bacterium GW2011_GWA1_36_8]KKQ74905.1 MAG: hypothetical protein US96_C0022G0011 [Candidatus Woesebacteria bacterium GW2011_GWB1_38_5b]OGE17164.1 MAG: hypothetical protein A2858_00475 [Candidatus Daviesbacteria bacterium RIFCSPHIGHO2_01_FULL_36_37]OGE35945.1 MAG: hypothetical protein A3E66_01470 [Candidatus Daviesbacteria bacterium RIFCSPHIGHO2_12_F